MKKVFVKRRRPLALCRLANTFSFTVSEVNASLIYVLIIVNYVIFKSQKQNINWILRCPPIFFCMGCAPPLAESLARPRC